jgi:hypothetical protein
LARSCVKFRQKQGEDHHDAAEAAAWFGRMQDGRGKRWVRALRIITEAVA